MSRCCAAVALALSLTLAPRAVAKAPSSEAAPATAKKAASATEAPKAKVHKVHPPPPPPAAVCDGFLEKDGFTCCKRECGSCANKAAFCGPYPVKAATRSACCPETIRSEGVKCSADRKGACLLPAPPPPPWNSCVSQVKDARDSDVRLCSPFCAEAKAESHCKFCKCQDCPYCAAVTPPSSVPSGGAPASTLATVATYKASSGTTCAFDWVIMTKWKSGYKAQALPANGMLWPANEVVRLYFNNAATPNNAWGIVQGSLSTSPSGAGGGVVVSAKLNKAPADGGFGMVLRTTGDPGMPTRPSIKCGLLSPPPPPPPKPLASPPPPKPAKAPKAEKTPKAERQEKAAKAITKAAKIATEAAKLAAPPPPAAVAPSATGATGSAAAQSGGSAPPPSGAASATVAPSASDLAAAAPKSAASSFASMLLALLGVILAFGAVAGLTYTYTIREKYGKLKPTDPVPAAVDDDAFTVEKRAFGGGARRCGGGDDYASVEGNGMDE